MSIEGTKFIWIQLIHESTCFHKRFNRFLCYNAQYTGAVCKNAPSHTTLTDFSCSCDVSRQLSSNFDQTERQIFKAVIFRKSLSEVEFLGNHWSQGPSTNNLSQHSRALQHSCHSTSIKDLIVFFAIMHNTQVRFVKMLRVIQRSLIFLVPVTSPGN